MTVSEILKPDFEMANRYFDVLTSSKDQAITFQFFDDKKKNRKLATHRAMKRPFDFDLLQKKQNKGCGVYIMVNRGDGKGRKKNNVVEVRALFIDLDGSPWEPVAATLKPHMRVESSLGRFHLYWKVSDCSLEQFKPLQQAIAKKFNGDKSCCDLPRVLRVPGFYHMKKISFLTRLVDENDFPSYTAQEIVDGLGLPVDATASITQPPRTPLTATAAPVSKGHECADTHGEVSNLTAWAANNPLFDIVGNCNKQFVRGEIKDGKQHIQCPFEHEHTDPNPDLATFIVNADPPEHPAFIIHCMHAHCEGRDRLDFLAAMLKRGMLSADILQTPVPQIKKPSYANYPAQEIAELCQLRSLNHNEFRILLNIMHLSLLQYDGTLPNNDWILARSLGLNETEWLAYKDTLIRTEWLIIADGQLFGPIFRREFIKSQIALDRHRKSGSIGGKKSAANKVKTKG